MGAGIIGLSCAWRLAQKGISVRVFDAREAAREASWAGAGMLAPGGEFEGPSDLADFALRSLETYPEFVRELEEETGAKIDFRQCGAIEVAFSDAEAEALSAKAARQAEIHIDSEPTTHNGFPARHYPRDAVVSPRDVTRALIAVCRRLGVAIHENEPVLEVAPGGRAVRTERGEYVSEGVLIAAGAWSSALLPGLPVAVPVRGHLISWAMKPGFLEPILRNGPTYLLQRQSGLLIAGASTESVGFDRNLDDLAVADLRARAGKLLPALTLLEPNEHWNGFRPRAATEDPVIGRIEDTSIWTAYGHYRNGILLAPETASRVAALIGQR